MAGAHRPTTAFLPMGEADREFADSAVSKHLSMCRRTSRMQRTRRAVRLYHVSERVVRCFHLRRVADPGSFGDFRFEADCPEDQSCMNVQNWLSSCVVSVPRIRFIRRQASISFTSSRSESVPEHVAGPNGAEPSRPGPISFFAPSVISVVMARYDFEPLFHFSLERLVYF